MAQAEASTAILDLIEKAAKDLAGHSTINADSVKALAEAYAAATGK
jgi:hypothetical protein